MKGLAQSVQTRLVRHAHTLELDPNLVLVRFGMERLLYRLSRSPHAERFVLKGGLLLLVWLGEAIRPTRDADLLGLGEMGTDTLRGIFMDLCTLEVQPDGLDFDPTTIRVDQIRVEDPSGGRRVLLWAHLGSARIRLQVDIGMGDGVVPQPEWIDYPSLLDFSRPRLRAYRQETAIAEKLHAMVLLDTKNSRMRDFFDIDALAAQKPFEGEQLRNAITATFRQRGTSIPRQTPVGLTPAFAEIPGKDLQWQGFVRRLVRPGTSPALGAIIGRLAVFAGPVVAAASRDETFARHWVPGGPWQ